MYKITRSRVEDHYVDGVAARIHLFQAEVSDEFLPVFKDPTSGRTMIYPSFTLTQDGCIEGDEESGPVNLTEHLLAVIRAERAAAPGWGWSESENYFFLEFMKGGRAHYSRGSIWPDFSLDHQTVWSATPQE